MNVINMNGKLRLGTCKSRDFFKGSSDPELRAELDVLFKRRELTANLTAAGFLLRFAQPLRVEVPALMRTLKSIDRAYRMEVQGALNSEVDSFADAASYYVKYRLNTTENMSLTGVFASQLCVHRDSLESLFYVAKALDIPVAPLRHVVMTGVRALKYLPELPRSTVEGAMSILAAKQKPTCWWINPELV